MTKKSPEQASIDLLRKKFGRDAALLLSEGGLEVTVVSPTGITVLDRFVLGLGGLPHGRFVEIHGPEGCLAEGAHIQYAVRGADGKAQNSKGGPIGTLFRRFHRLVRKGQGAQQRPQTVGSWFSAPCLNEEGRIFHNRIADVVATGRRPCFEVTVAGLSEPLQATVDHKFWTGEQFVPLGSLKRGDTIYVHNNTPYRKAEADEEKRPSRAYLYVDWHPTAGVKVVRSIKNRTTKERGHYEYHRLLRSRAVVEARMNGMTLDTYVGWLDTGESNVGTGPDLVFLPRDVEVHHIDENVLNDSIENLVVLTPQEHARRHAIERHNNLRFAAVPSVITKIRPVGPQTTYDIRMEAPFNNYVASGFVVHNSGKTTLADKCMAGHQRDGGVVYLNDVENKFDPKWAALHGVDVDKVVLMQDAECAEDWLAQVELLLDHGPDVPMMFVLDSIADIKVRREIDEGVVGEGAMAEAARIWSQSLKLLKPKVRKKGAIVLALNQLRDKPGVMYGQKTQTTGGNAWRFAFATRLEVHHGQHVKKGTTTTGRLVHVKAVKHQVSPPYRSCTLRLDFLEGFNDRWSVLDHAKDVGCVSKDCKSFKEAAFNLGWMDLLDKAKDAPDEIADDLKKKED